VRHPCLFVAAALTLGTTACSGQGYGTFVRIFGPDLEEVETYDFVRANFEPCSGCDWTVGVTDVEGSGSYADGFGWDEDLRALSMYTIPGSGIDDVRSGWGPFLDRVGLEERGYTFSSTFTDEALALLAEKPSFGPNRCEGEPTGDANQTYDVGVPSGSLSGEATCGAFATHTITVPAGQTLRVWMQTDVPIVPRMLLAHEGCLAGSASDAIPCSGADPYKSCPAMTWRTDGPSSITLVIDTFGWTCDSGAMPYTLLWTGDGSTVGPSTPTDDPSPALLPYADTFQIDFDLTGSAPAP